MAALVAVGIPMVDIPRALLAKLLEHSAREDPMALLAPTLVRQFLLADPNRTKEACRYMLLNCIMKRWIVWPKTGAQQCK